MNAGRRDPVTVMLDMLMNGEEAVHRLQADINVQLESDLIGPAIEHRKTEHGLYRFGSAATSFIKSVTSVPPVADGVIRALLQTVLDQRQRIADLEGTVLRLDGDLLDAQGRLADAQEAAVAAESYYRATGTAGEIDAHNALVETFEARRRNLNNTVTVDELKAKGIQP